MPPPHGAVPQYQHQPGQPIHNQNLQGHPMQGAVPVQNFQNPNQPAMNSQLGVQPGQPVGQFPQQLPASGAFQPNQMNMQPQQAQEFQGQPIQQPTQRQQFQGQPIQQAGQQQQFQQPIQRQQNQAQLEQNQQQFQQPVQRQNADGNPAPQRKTP